MVTILQWNINGIRHHFHELKLLISNQDPTLICLQETHLRPQMRFNIRGFNCHRYDDTAADQRAKGGVAIFTKENLHAVPVTIQSELQVVAVQVTARVKFTLCNIYLPTPDWTSAQINNILAQLPRPFLIVGDFNSHNPLWGSEKTDASGRRVEEIIDTSESVLLNNGDGTYLNSISNCPSHIDLSFCSPSLAPYLFWSVLKSDLYTDHFPIKIVLPHTPTDSTPKLASWDILRGDWDAYQQQVTLPTINPFYSTADEAEMITQAILTAAEATVPQKRQRNPRRCVPWWNPTVAAAIKDKKRALTTFRRQMTLSNMINF